MGLRISGFRVQGSGFRVYGAPHLCVLCSSRERAVERAREREREMERGERREEEERERGG